MSGYEIPLFNLNYDEREEEAILAVLRSKWLSSGPKTNELENAFKKDFDVDYAVATSSCSSALHLSLLALDIGPGDEVICPSLSFVATANCIRYVGANPVFCDIEHLDRPVIDPVEIEKSISDKTKALIVMHYAGFACDMDRIMSLAKQHDLFVIEDACHAPLSEYQGQKIGSIGDVGCFSFYANKNISTGEGGMMITKDEKLAEKAKLLRSHGMTTMSYDRFKGHATTYDVVELGFNFRFDDMRAALALVQLEKVKEESQKRNELRKQYIEALAGVERINIPFSDDSEKSSNYIFSSVLEGNSEQRNLLREFLHKNGIQTSLHYPPIHLFSIYRKGNQSLPNTEAYSNQTITLPLYPTLKSDQIQFICQKIQEGLNEIF